MSSTSDEQGPSWWPPVVKPAQVHFSAEPVAATRARRRTSLAAVFPPAADVTEAERAWLRAFWETRAGNYAGEFYFADKKNDERVIKVLLTVFRTDRSPYPGKPWTWSLQVLEGPRRMIMERPQYSNLYFAGPHVAALDVLADLDKAGFVLGQPRQSSVSLLLGEERQKVEVAETGVVSTGRRKRVVDTE